LNPLPMVSWPPYPWYFESPLMVSWTPYPWYIEPTSHGILNPLYMVYWQARSSLYANTQLRAHRRAEKKNKEQKIK
jgi:hypothetical protein